MNARVVITREESARVGAFICRVGWLSAVARLGVGPMTLEEARDRGSMRTSTRDRLFAALAREEAVLS